MTEPAVQDEIAAAVVSAMKSKLFSAPVVGHVGLRPQAVHVDGGFKATGRLEGIERRCSQRRVLPSKPLPLR